MTPTFDQTHAKTIDESDDGFSSSIEYAPCDEKEFCEKMEFPQGIDDDYLLMDGLEIADDFDGLLDISESSAFEPSGEESFDETSPSRDPSCKRQHERPHSPPPKKIKAMNLNNSSPVSVMSIASVPSLTSIPHLSNENEDLQDEYRRALQHLALSMRRSEMTRNEIIRQRKEAETRAKLEAAQHRTVSNAENFLVGKRATLTTGLDQSRRMLRTLVAQATTQPF